MTPSAVKRDLIDTIDTQEKAVDYARVSSSPQDRMSLETQHDENRGYAVRKNLRIVRSFEDVGSGLSTKQRPQFLEMVEYVLDKRNGINHVIFFDLDRFTRRNRDFYIYTEDLEQAGIYLHNVVENQVYSRDSALSWQIKAWANEGNSRSTAFHTKRGQRGAVRAGAYIGKKPPYGYRIYYKDVDGQKQPRLEKHPDEWPHLLKIIEMGLNKKSPLNIARYLNGHGIPGPSGQDWTEDTVRSILQNEHYTGYTFRGKHPKSRLPGRPEEMPVEYSKEQAHDAALSYEEYYALQEIIAGRAVSRGPTRSHSSPHTFSDVAKCGECGTPERLHNLIIIRSYKRNKDGDNETKEAYEPKLRCAKKKHQGAATCPKKDIHMGRFQDLICDRLVKYIFTQENLERQVKSAAKSSKGFLQKEEANSKALQSRLDTIEEQLRNGNGLVLEFGKKLKHIDSLMEEIDNLGRERQAMAAEIERAAETTREAKFFLTDPQGLIDTLLDYKTYTESEEPDAVRDLALTFIQRIEVFNDHIDIYYHLSPELVNLKDNLRKETITLKADNDRDRKKRCLLGKYMGICMVLNKGAMAVSRLTSSQRARASWVSTNSAPEPAVAESMAALRLDCHPSNTRGLGPPGSRIWAASRLRTQARSRWSKPVYLP